MARVPTLDNFSVAATGPGGQEVRAPSTEGFDAPARQLAQTSATAAQNAEAYNARVLQAQREANQIRVLDAENKAREAALHLAYDPNEGYSQVRGGAVMERESGMPLADEYRQKYTTALSDIAGTLSNSMQRQMFARVQQNLTASFAEQADRHQATEYRGYQRSVVTGARDLSAQEIAASGGDFDKIDDALTNRLLPAVAASGQMQGMSANEITALQNVNKSAALTAAMQSAINREDITTAGALFDRYKDDLVEEDRSKVQGVIEREGTGRLILGIADDAMSGLTTPAGQIGMPVEGGRVTGRFGDDRPGHLHNGVDIAVPIGSPVRATISGTVKAREGGDGGRELFIVSDDGKTQVGFAHLDEYKVQPGARVTKGQIVAASGNTGKSSGPHVHYTVTVDGKRVDPLGKEAKASAPATVADALARAEDALLATRPNASPREIKALREEVTYRWQVHEAAKRDADEKTMSQVYAGLIKNGGDLRALPASLRSAIPPDKYDSALGFSRSLRQPAPRDPAHDDVLYNAAVSDPKALAASSDSQFLQRYVGHPQFNSIATYRAQLQGKRPAGGAGKDTSQNIDYTALNRVVASRLNGLGMAAFPKDDPAAAAQVGAIKRVATGQIVSAQQRLGRQLTDVEVERVVDGVFMQTTPTTKTFLGIPTGAGSGMQRVTVKIGDVPAATRRNIETALTRNGVPITDEAVLSAYYAGVQ